MVSRLHDFWMAVHRYSGLAMLVFLGFAALTGCLMCFMRPLDVALNSDLFRQQAVASPPPVAALVDRFRAEHPEWTVRSFPLAVAADARIPVKVEPSAGKNPIGVNQLFLDRGTGALAGARSDEPALSRQGAIRLLHDAHYTLMLGTGGRWFMGVVAVVWLISNLVGLYLTFPVRGAFWKQWKRSWKVGFRSPFPRLMMDLHRASGLWLLVPFTLLAFTSVGFNFFAEGYGPVVDRLFPEAEAPIAAPAPATGAELPLSFAGAVAQATARARRMGEGWQPATVLYEPQDNRIGVTLTDDGTLNYRYLGPIYLYFDAASGRLAEVLDPYHGNRNLAAYRILYPIHSGRIAGLPTVALVFVSGLATFAMCVTGVYLWWKKRPSRMRRRKRAEPALSRSAR